MAAASQRRLRVVGVGLRTAVATELLDGLIVAGLSRVLRKIASKTPFGRTGLQIQIFFVPPDDKAELRVRGGFPGIIVLWKIVNANALEGNYDITVF